MVEVKIGQCLHISAKKHLEWCTLKRDIARRTDERGRSMGDVQQSLNFLFKKAFFLLPKQRTEWFALIFSDILDDHFAKGHQCPSPSMAMSSVQSALLMSIRIAERAQWQWMGGGSACAIKWPFAGNGGKSGTQRDSLTDEQRNDRPKRTPQTRPDGKGA